MDPVPAQLTDTQAQAAVDACKAVEGFNSQSSRDFVRATLVGSEAQPQGSTEQKRAEAQGLCDRYNRALLHIGLSLSVADPQTVVTELSPVRVRKAENRLNGALEGAALLADYGVDTRGMVTQAREHFDRATTPTTSEVSGVEMVFSIVNSKQLLKVVGGITPEQAGQKPWSDLLTRISDMYESSIFCFGKDATREQALDFINTANEYAQQCERLGCGRDTVQRFAEAITNRFLHEQLALEWAGVHMPKDSSAYLAHIPTTTHTDVGWEIQRFSERWAQAADALGELKNRENPAPYEKYKIILTECLEETGRRVAQLTDADVKERLELALAEVQLP